MPLRTPAATRSDPRLAANGGTKVVTEDDFAPPVVDAAVLAATVADLVASGATFRWYGGKYQREFEETFAGLVGARHAVMCASGSAALRLMLHLVAAGPGRTVAVPTFTFHSVLTTVLAAGAKPMLLAVDPSTLVLDVDRAAAELPPAAVVMVVHAIGRAVDVARLRALRPDVVVIEDAADAQGTTLNGRQVGTGGDLGTCWSFTTSHNEVHTAGVAGMVTTQDSGVAARLRRLAHYGKDHRSVTPGTTLNPVPVEPGSNYMTTELEAAVGAATAAVAVPAWRRRRQVGRAIEKGLAALGLSTPPEPEGCGQNYYDVLFTLPSEWRPHREWLLDALVAEGCPAWTYHSVFELPWLEEQLAGRAAWGTREDELRRSDPLRDVALLGMRPSFTLDGVHTAVRAVEKVLMGEPDGD